MEEKAKRYKLVAVPWEDITTIPGWTSEGEEMQDVMKVLSVGYLVDSTPDMVYLASAIAVNYDQVNCITMIPRGAMTGTCRVIEQKEED